MNPAEDVRAREADAVRTTAENDISRDLAAIQRDSYGESVRRIQTTILDDSVISILDVELLPHERTLLQGDKGAETVCEVRRSYQRAIGPSFIAVVERATGRRVVAFLSETHISPSFSIEFFRLGPDLSSSEPTCLPVPARG